MPSMLLGPARADGLREIRLVREQARDIPSAGSGFSVVDVPSGMKPRRHQYYNPSTEAIVSKPADSGDDKAVLRFASLFDQWRRVRDLESFKDAYSEDFPGLASIYAKEKADLDAAIALEIANKPS